MTPFNINKFNNTQFTLVFYTLFSNIIAQTPSPTPSCLTLKVTILDASGFDENDFNGLYKYNGLDIRNNPTWFHPQAPSHQIIDMFFGAAWQIIGIGTNNKLFTNSAETFPPINNNATEWDHSFDISQKFHVSMQCFDATYYPTQNPTSNPTYEPTYVPTLNPTIPEEINCNFNINNHILQYKYNNEPKTFKFQLNWNRIVSFSTCGTNWDTSLTLYEEDWSTIITQCDDCSGSSTKEGITSCGTCCGASNLQSDITLFLSPGIYYYELSVSSFVTHPIYNNYTAKLQCHTTAPSLDPTLDPTFKATTHPTNYPTQYPTINPTFDPSKYPTTIPTLYPSIDPTINPTKNPSKYPSKYPTKYPSRLPSSNPTLQPSNNPSVHPIISPTVIPTIYPTKNPSETPSLRPTIHPTIHPTTSYMTVSDDIEITPYSTIIQLTMDKYSVNEVKWTIYLIACVIISIVVVIIIIVIICLVVMSLMCWGKNDLKSNKVVNNVEQNRKSKHGYKLTNIDSENTNKDIPLEHTKLIDNTLQSDSIELLQIEDANNEFSDDDEDDNEDMYVDSQPTTTHYDPGPNAELVQKWLQSVVKLPQYYDIFVNSGFNSFELMVEINKIQYLNYIGINNKAHQIKLMNHIQKLHNKKNGGHGEIGEQFFNTVL